jgi:hypothetical protein
LFEFSLVFEGKPTKAEAFGSSSSYMYMIVIQGAVLGHDLEMSQCQARGRETGFAHKHKVIYSTTDTSHRPPQHKTIIISAVGLGTTHFLAFCHASCSLS